MSGQRRNGLLVGGAALALAVCATLAWHVAQPSASAVDRDEAAAAGRSGALAAAAPPPAWPELPGPVWTGGVALAADYRFEMDGGAQVGPIQVELHGELQLATPLDVEGARWLPARLTHIEAKLSAAAQRLLGGDAAAGLELPLLVRLDAGERVAELRFDPATTISVRGVLADLVQAAQWSRPATADARRWTVEELDSNGSHSATYVRSAAATVERSWRTPADRTAERLATTTRFALDDEGVATVAQRTTGTVSTGNILANQHTPLTMAIDLRRAGVPDLAWAKGLSPQRMVAFADRSGEADRPATTPPHRPAAEVLREVVARASAIGVGGRTNLRNELTYALRDDDAAVGPLEQTLREGTLDAKAESVAIAALTGAGTERAQRAVADLLDDTTLTERTTLAVLQAAAFVQRPGAAFLDRLEASSADLSRPAHASGVATALGAALGQLKASDPQAAAPRIRVYLGRASKVLTGHDEPPAHPDAPGATSEEPAPVAVRIAWLAGLGNTADPSALPVLFAGLVDSNELVRGSAALALRFQDPGAAMPWMTKLMATDPSIHVRENIVDAARFMGPKAGRPLVEKALYYDESHHVRTAAAYTLSVWSNDVPTLRAVMTDALKREKHPRVAEALQNYLQMGRVPGSPVISGVHVQ